MKVLEMTNGTGVNVVYESVGSTLGKVLTLLKLAVLSYFTEWLVVILRQLIRVCLWILQNFNWWRPLERAYHL